MSGRGKRKAEQSTGTHCAAKGVAGVCNALQVFRLIQGQNHIIRSVEEKKKKATAAMMGCGKVGRKGRVFRKKKRCYLEHLKLQTDALWAEGLCMFEEKGLQWADATLGDICNQRRRLAQQLHTGLGGVKEVEGGSERESVCVFACVCMCACLHVCLSVYLSVYPSVYLSVCPFVYLSAPPPFLSDPLSPSYTLSHPLSQHRTLMKATAGYTISRCFPIHSVCPNSSSSSSFSIAPFAAHAKEEWWCEYHIASWHVCL